MVIYYNKDGYIELVEQFTMSPFMLENEDIETVIEHYKKQGLTFKALEDGAGGDILNNKVILDEEGNYKGLEILPEQTPDTDDEEIVEEYISQEERITELENTIDSLLGRSD